MKKLILASLTVIAAQLSIAQTVNTQIAPAKSSGETNLSAKIKADDDVRAERFAMRMKQLLGLNEEQHGKLLTLKKEKNVEVRTIDNKFNGVENSDEARLKELTPVSDAYKKSLKEIFTAEQYTKWEENVNMRFERWKTAVNAQPNAPKQNESLQRIRIEME